MNKDVDLRDLQKKLDRMAIDETMIFAARLVLWLLVEKNMTVKNALASAKKKYPAHSKAAIERLVRQVMPESFFLKRANDFKKAHFSMSPEQAVNAQKLRQEEKRQIGHIQTIVQTVVQP